MTTSICKAGSSATADCIDSAQPDGHKQNSKSAYVRVGHHAYDRSYVQYYVGHSAADSLPNATNASIEYTVTNGASSAMPPAPIGAPHCSLESSQLGAIRR